LRAPEPDIVVWGAAGHALVLADALARRGLNLVALFDNAPPAVSPIAGIPVYRGWEGFLDWLSQRDANRPVTGLVAIGGARGADRLAIQERLAAVGVPLLTLIHPDATVHADVQLGAGTQVLAQSVVAAGSVLGRNCIVNHRVGIDHECRIGAGVHLAPGATLCGCIEVGDRAFIGAGAVVLPRLTIGTDAIVGAGAVVTRSVPDGVTVAGNPARTIQP
jgi:sugar O-acyltransferase (sialic acid O-acetyltransferase NeuD family)